MDLDAAEPSDRRRDALPHLLEAPTTEQRRERGGAVRLSARVRVHVCAADEEGAVGVDEASVEHARDHQLPVRIPPQHRQQEQRLRPVGHVPREPPGHTVAGSGGEEAERLLDGRGRGVEEVAQLVAPAQLRRRELREDPHQNLGREGIEHLERVVGKVRCRPSVKF